MASNNKQQQPTVIYVERKANHSLLWFILFGWWWVAWVTLKWCVRAVTWPFRFAAKVGWKTLVEWPVRVCVVAWQWSVRGVRATYARWGMRGIAVAAGVIIVLGVLGTILGNH